MPDPSSPIRAADDAASRGRSRSAFDGVLEAFIRLMLGVIVTAIAVQFFHARIGPWEAMVMGGALAVAAAFGLVLGLLAAAIALLADHFVLGASLPPPDPASPAAVPLVLFVVTVVAVGLSADLARQRRSQTAPRLEAARRASPPVSAGVTARVAKAAPRPAGRSAAALGRIATWRALASLALALAIVAGALALHRVTGPTLAALAALIGAAIGAAQTGPRLGLAAGAVTAVLLLRALPSSGAAGVAGAQAAIEVILFGAVGWVIGALADDLRQARAARRTLIAAGRALSAGGDETKVRNMLLESLTRIDHAGRFELRDDAGGAIASPAGKPVQDGGNDPSWRARRLVADGRDLGEVRWRFPGAGARAQALDDLAAAIVDLGASAILRARLSAENSDMENITRAEQLRTLLLDAVLHHFRTPLAGILGSVTSILNLPEPQDRKVHRDFLLIIKEQANRLNRYVDNFLSLARLEAGAIEVNLAEVNIEMLIYDVWDSFGAIGGARRYFQVDLDVEMVRSDAALLTQVFGNILENAIKYSSEESLVEVRSHRDGDQLMIEVLDQGCGVPEASVPRLFDRFYRSHAAKTPGLGLGLYITRSLVERLGGVLSARNRSDGQTGLVVSIGLPIAEGAS